MPVEVSLPNTSNSMAAKYEWMNEWWRAAAHIRLNKVINTQITSPLLSIINEIGRKFAKGAPTGRWGWGGRFKHPLLEYGRKEKKINFYRMRERRMRTKNILILIFLIFLVASSLSLSLRAMRSFFWGVASMLDLLSGRDVREQRWVRRAGNIILWRWWEVFPYLFGARRQRGKVNNFKFVLRLLLTSLFFFKAVLLRARTCGSKPPTKGLLWDIRMLWWRERAKTRPCLNICLESSLTDSTSV